MVNICWTVMHAANTNILIAADKKAGTKRHGDVVDSR